MNDFISLGLPTIITDSLTAGGFTEPTDPDLRNQYINEVLLGYEMQVGPEVAVGIKGVAAGTGNDDAALLIIPLD